MNLPKHSPIFKFGRHFETLRALLITTLTTPPSYIINQPLRGTSSGRHLSPAYIWLGVNETNKSEKLYPESVWLLIWDMTSAIHTWILSSETCFLDVNNLFGAVWNRNLSDRRTSRTGYFVPPIKDKYKIRWHFSDKSYYLHRLGDSAILLLLLSRNLFFHWPTFHACRVLQIILNLYKAQLLQVLCSSGRFDRSFWLDCFASV